MIMKFIEHQQEKDIANIILPDKYICSFRSKALHLGKMSTKSILLHDPDIQRKLPKSLVLTTSLLITLAQAASIPGQIVK